MDTNSSNTRRPLRNPTRIAKTMRLVLTVTDPQILKFYDNL